MADFSISKTVVSRGTEMHAGSTSASSALSYDWVAEASRAKKLEDQGKFGQAEKLYRKRVLDEAAKYKANQSEERLDSLNESRQQLSGVLFKQKDFVGAEELLRQSLTDLEVQHGQMKNEDVLKILGGWLNLENRTEKLEQTDRLFKKHLSEAKSEIKRYGTDPRTWLVESMQQNQVLALGESHVYDGVSEHHRLGGAMMQELKEAGATHLAVELASNHQDLLDRFVATGQMDLSLLDSSKGTEEYSSSKKFCESKDLLAVLDSARKAGLKLVAVDDADSINAGALSAIFGSKRDKAIATNIAKILAESPQNKITFWAGAIHTQVAVDKRDNERACEILREKGLGVVSVLPKAYDSMSDEDPCRTFVTGLQKPTLLPMRKAKDFSKLPELRTIYPSVQNFNAWDAVIFYPPKKAESTSCQKVLR